MNQAHTDINLVPGQAPHRELTVAIGAVTRSKREGSRYREAMQNHPGPNPPWQNHAQRHGRTTEVSVRLESIGERVFALSPVVGPRGLRSPTGALRHVPGQSSVSPLGCDRVSRPRARPDR